MAPYGRVLVANRGEIALRIIRTCREVGIETVAVYSRADNDSLHVERADMACCIGEGDPGDSYMNIPNVICAALELEARAIHPGYGFLSEDARFAEICDAHGLAFIGPGADALRLAGDKLLMREVADSAGVPVPPASSRELSLSSAREQAGELGFPLVLKPRSGGGGRGIRYAGDGESLSRILSDPATRECVAGGGFFLERCVTGARHIEVQLLADQTGRTLAAGVRDCSIQRNRQKIIEEAPPVHLSGRTRDRLVEAALRVSRASGFTTAGTAEFLVNDDGFYFIELNPRIQVEHTVTEMLTGLDLVWEQIRLSAGETLEGSHGPPGCRDHVHARDVRSRGHAVQARICAEHPGTPRGLLGRVENLRFPGGPGVRVDTHLYPGCSVPFIYDPLLAKVVTWAPTRAEALRRMSRALSEVRIDGVETNLPLLVSLIDSSEFRHGHYRTDLLEKIGASGFSNNAAGDHAGAAMREREAVSNQM